MKTQFENEKNNKTRSVKIFNLLIFIANIANVLTYATFSSSFCCCLHFRFNKIWLFHATASISIFLTINLMQRTEFSLMQIWVIFFDYIKLITGIIKICIIYKHIMNKWTNIIWLNNILNKCFFSRMLCSCCWRTRIYRIHRKCNCTCWT